MANQNASSEELKAQLDAVTKASHTVSSKLYEAGKAAPGGDAGAGGAGAGGAEGKAADGEDVIDADYKDVN